MTPETPRRQFLKTTATAAALIGLTGVSFLQGCDNDKKDDVSPAEDLMREHGLLNRILLVYDTCKIHLINNETFSIDAMIDAAQIIRHFIEDYHEKLEEDFLFPRFEKANYLSDLVLVLRRQHQAGRIITDRLINIGKLKSFTHEDNQKVIKLLSDFNRMYRPHEAREDTILFPGLKKIITPNEYDSLGEDFEKKEQELFGKGGFESMVDKVAEIEKQLDIYDLAKFTPILNETNQ